MAWLDRPLKSPTAPAGIVSLELAGSEAAANRVVRGWSQREQRRAAFNLGIDYLYLIVYSSAIGLSCATVAQRFTPNSRARLLGRGLAWAQLGAALADAVENAALLLVLDSRWLELGAAVAARAAQMKFGLIALGLLYVLVSGTFAVVRCAARRRDGPASDTRPRLELTPSRAVFAALVCWIAVFSQNLSASTPQAPAGILSLQLASSTSAIDKVCQSWNDSQRRALCFGLGLDQLFIVAYVSALALVAKSVAERGAHFNRSVPKILAQIAIGLAVVAGLADVSENALHYQLIDGVGGEMAGLGAHRLALLKFTALAVSLALVIAAYLGTRSAGHGANQRAWSH